jgi:hypothetical protein
MDLMDGHDDGGQNRKAVIRFHFIKLVDCDVTYLPDGEHPFNQPRKCQSFFRNFPSDYLKFLFFVKGILQFECDLHEV